MQFTCADALKIGIGIIEKIVSGVVLIYIGLWLYKRTKRKQTITDAEIQKEIKLKYIVNEFKRIRNKYTKPLTSESFSSKVEEEVTNLYSKCDELESHCKAFNLNIESDFHLLTNLLFCYKGVLYCNNPTQIDDEKVSFFLQIQKWEGVKLDKESHKQFYFKEYQFFLEKVDTGVKTGKFLKKYW